ncbi:hypothetical protein FRACYDRAFT_181871 [Fragilariopsis cylindrus CCMP1102]|uniref:EamA domain-containing protein n=1 Tax=Fragilariopsis cylindrus CCMP1102 TaxID=635003 RepID=A0A1E7FNU3_9STRA|nr:hypothetical protein FRACYDRAFT_181871 [Fragilariopsis cylindrus CCMP1102]|eukprot:OEU19806.1 hypothetical protein FRACYDRAFT_181871 [Fragilariopsis cylindrus CCMP1102]
MPSLNISSYALGLVFIVLVAIIWSIASILVQYLYHNQDFHAPFLLTYIGTSLFVIQLPLNWLYKRWVEYRRCRNSRNNHAYESIPMTNNNNSNHHWTERDHMIAAAKIAPVWFISNFAYNASLQYTSITSSTVLVNTGSLFTFMIALFMRDESFSYYKLTGVLLGMTGCILTGYHDAAGSGGGDGSLDNGRLLILGDILSVVSAAFYGIYAVMVRVLCPHDESLMSMQLFLGYVGLWNMIFLSPIAIYQLGIARNVTLSAWVFSCVVIKGLFDNVLSDYLWARSVILTSATVASVGLGLTIPLAFVSDIFIGIEDVVNFESMLGAGFVLFGFILVNMGQKQEEEEGSTTASLTERYDDDNVGIECVSEEEDPARQLN